MFSVTAAFSSALRPVGRRAGRVCRLQEAPQTGQLHAEGEEEADQDRGVAEDRRYESGRLSLRGLDNTSHCVESNYCFDFGLFTAETVSTTCCV